MTEEDLLNTPFTTPQLEAAVALSTATLAERWLASMPATQRTTATAGAVFEMTLTPRPRLSLMLVDEEGNRWEVAARDIFIAPRH